MLFYAYRCWYNGSCNCRFLPVCPGILQKRLDYLMAAMDSGFFGFGSGPDEVIASLSELSSQLQRDFAK